MTEEAKAAQEIAKAAQEGAKAAPAVIEAGSDLARWVGRVLGTVPEDIVGLALGDYLHHYRIRNLALLSKRTDQILKERGVTEPRTISPKLAIPTFEAASEEGDETLQELWANLLANAMDPNRDVSLRRIFIDTLKELEPVDALVFDALVSMDLRGDAVPIAINVARKLALREAEAELSLIRLTQLGCAKGPDRLKIFGLATLGRELWLACRGNTQT